MDLLLFRAHRLVWVGHSSSDVFGLRSLLKAVPHLPSTLIVILGEHQDEPNGQRDLQAALSPGQTDAVRVTLAAVAIL